MLANWNWRQVTQRNLCITKTANIVQQKTTCSLFKVLLTNANLHDHRSGWQFQTILLSVITQLELTYVVFLWDMIIFTAGHRWHISMIINYICWLIMATLWNRAGHYIFLLWFLLPSFFLSFCPRLFSADADWMSTIHGVALVRI